MTKSSFPGWLFTRFRTRDTDYNELNESSGFVSDTSVKILERESCETTQYSTAKPTRLKPNMAAPMHPDGAREKKSCIPVERIGTTLERNSRGLKSAQSGPV